MFVEQEFSTSENLPVKKQKLEIKEDNLFSFNYKNPVPIKIGDGIFFDKKLPPKLSYSFFNPLKSAI